MTTYYYTFRSMTAALNATQKLKSRGINVKPVRTPEQLRKKGCGYCIPVEEERMRRIRGALLPTEYEKLYRSRDGMWEELDP